MTKDDIIRMALEASGGTFWWPVHGGVLERFAALVAAAERAACASVCENFNADHQDCNYYDRAMVEAIRKRGEK